MDLVDEQDQCSARIFPFKNRERLSDRAGDWVRDIWQFSQMWYAVMMVASRANRQSIERELLGHLTEKPALSA